MSSKKVYILMATYKGEKYIKEQLDSILNQTYQNWKLIIHDDNSKDNTVQIIKEYARKYSDKIEFIDDGISTGGAKENFAYLLNKINGDFDYLMFSDQDDVWLKDKIKITIKKMIKLEKKFPNKPVLVHTDIKIVDENLNVISESMVKYQKLNIYNQNNLKFLAIENIITGCTMMINKILYNLCVPIPKEAIMHDWWIGIITLKYGGIIEFLDNATILYRQHASNEVGAKNIKFSYYFKKINNVKEIFSSYKKIIKQIRCAGIKISLVDIIFFKTCSIFRKLK